MTTTEPTYRVPIAKHPPRPVHGNTIPEQRPSVTRRRQLSGEAVYVAQVREPGGARTYIGRYGDMEGALKACRAYIDTGYLPPDAKRGSRPGQKQARPRKGKKKAAPTVACNADRLAMIARIARRLE